ncbi:MAG: hypothetical protein CR961_00080 [Polaribacter sp.]|nr:MAG: hypothetical protein CR961_00080 [Polaribacter sp.]
MKKLQYFIVLFTYLLLSCSDDNIVENDLQQSNNVESTFLTQKEASNIAEKFLNAQQPKTKAGDFNLEMVYTDLTNEVATKSNKKPAYYIFNIGGEGFVIVSANKVTLPILGYSFESKFDAKNVPVNMVDILDDYKIQINKVRQEGLVANEKIESIRQNYLQGGLRTKSGDNSIAPLLGEIRWHQTPYYNDKCPEGTPVGCVATATAQIMRYYKYPSRSKGKFSYEHKKYGVQYFDYNYDIKWDLMPEKRLKEANEEVAKFCYGVAVGLKMNFAPKGSASAQTEVPDLLVKHYGYSKDVRNVYRSYYNDAQWKKIVLDELKAGRPVQYAGHGAKGGHSFVCDGYDGSNGYFHFNWGWGGLSDGFFLLENLNPLDQSTGGNGSNFNAGQKIIVNFAPPKGGNNDNNIGKFKGVYELKPASSLLKNLDVYKARRYNETNVGVFWDNNNSNQRWKIIPVGNDENYKIVPMNAIDKVLDIQGGKYEQGANVQIFEYKGTHNQQWKLISLGNGYYRISPAGNTKLSLTAKLNSNVVLSRTSKISIAQIWKLKKVE